LLKHRPFLILLFVAAILRFAGITSDSLWLDESYQSMVDAYGSANPTFLVRTERPFLFRFERPAPLPEMLRNFRQVDPLCPPLYAVLLNQWISAFGGSDFAVRCPSVIFSMLSIAITYGCGATIFGAGAGLMAALLQTVSPFDIHYAQEARMYSLLIMCSSMSCWSLWTILNRNAGGSSWMRWLAPPVYAVSTWAMINTHYTALFVLLFQGLYSILFCVLSRRLQSLLILGGCWSAILIMWLPWFDIFQQAASRRTASFYVKREASVIWPLTAILFRIPYNFLTFLSGKRVALYLVPVYASSFLLLLSGIFSLMPKLVGRFSKSAALFVAGWMFIPALLIWLIDVLENHRVVEIARYVVSSSTAVYLVAGIGAAALWRYSFGKKLILLHIVLCLANVLYTHMTPQREPWRDVAAAVQKQCNANQLILVCPYYNIVCLDRYLAVPMKQVGLSPDYSTNKISELMKDDPYIWLLTAQEAGSIRNAMPRNYQLDKRIRFPRGIELIGYKRVDAPNPPTN
jgi:mannosyltransferase